MMFQKIAYHRASVALRQLKGNASYGLIIKVPFKSNINTLFLNNSMGYDTIVYFCNCIMDTDQYESRRK